MNKNDLVQMVADKAGISKTEAGKAVDATFETIAAALAQKDTCQFIGFGSFKCSERAARTGRNPQTGAEIQIPASTSVRFIPGKKLKDAVQ